MALAVPRPLPLRPVPMPARIDPERVIEYCFHVNERHCEFIRTNPSEHRAVAFSIQNSLRPHPHHQMNPSLSSSRPITRTQTRAARHVPKAPSIPQPIQRNKRECQNPSAFNPLFLPLEILFIILENMDFQTLLYFRHVHPIISQLVPGIQHYKTITECALSTLAILLRTGTAAYVTVSDIYATLTERYCHRCNKKAPYVFLRTFARTCESCLLHDDDLRLYDKRSVTRALRVVWERRPQSMDGAEIANVLSPVREAIAQIPTVIAPKGYFPGRQWPYEVHSRLLQQGDIWPCIQDPNILNNASRMQLLQDVVKELQSQFESFSMRYRASTALP